MSPERSRNQKTGQVLVPSRELAWLIGALAGQGSVQFDRIQLMSSTEPLLSEFKFVGESIFGLNADYQPATRVRFYGRRIAAALGNLRRSDWPKTIVEQHSWLLNNQIYSWAFMEGLYDTVGTARVIPTRRRIVFAATYINAANFITGLLVNLDIRNPKLGKDRTQRAGIRGVVVENIRDIKKIAENIKSRVPLQEERLRILRSLDLQGKGSERNYPSSIEELIQEWIKLTKLLGHVPTRDEIFMARKLKQTRFSSEVYQLRFSTNNSFTVSKMVIERIVKDERIPSKEELNKLIQQCQKEQKSPNDNQVKRKLEKILGIKPSNFIHQGLFGPDGETVILPPLRRIGRRRNNTESMLESSSQLNIIEASSINIPHIGRVFNDIGYASRRIICLLSQSIEPIASSQLAYAVYGDKTNLTDSRQKVRMSISNVLNPRLKEHGYIIINTNDTKTHQEATYGLKSIDLRDQPLDIQDEPLLKWNPREDIFELTLPDNRIFKANYMLLAKLVVQLMRAEREVSMDELASELYGEYTSKTSDNVSHLIRKTKETLEPYGWSIVQKTSHAELRLGQKAKYSLINK